MIKQISEINVQLIEIKDNINSQKIVMQLLIHTLLKKLEDKEGLTDITQEIVNSLNSFDRNLSVGNRIVRAALKLTQDPLCNSTEV